MFDQSLVAPKNIANKRLEICEKCEFLFKPTFSCKKCGCFMKVKARLKDSRCPENKWEK